MTLRVIRPTAVLVLCLLCALGPGYPSSPAGVVAATVAPGAACGARVAVLGADLSPGGRFEVQRALRVGSHTVQVRETLADERLQAHGLIPASLLTNVAVSSALFKPLPVGAGLTVTLNPAITLDTAETYANALLTAGVTDAEVRIAAPTAQPALGTTALLGLLRAARVSCLTLTTVQQDLAIREVVMTSELARLPGDRALAPRLVAAMKATAVAAHLTAAAALHGLIVRVAAEHGVVVPEALQPSVQEFLRALVVSQVYARVVAGHLEVTDSGPTTVLVHLLPGSSSASGAPSAVPTTPLPPAKAAIRHGRLVSVEADRVVVSEADGRHLYPLSPALSVYRDGQHSSLQALQAGDAITLTISTGGAITMLHAASNVASVPSHPVVSHGGVATQHYGTIDAVETASILVRERGAVQTYPLAAHLQIYRAGTPDRLTGLRSGDSITVTTGADGAVTRLDAVPAPGASAAGTPALIWGLPGIFNLPLALAAAAFFLLLALSLIGGALPGRRRRKPPATAQRQTVRRL